MKKIIYAGVGLVVLVGIVIVLATFKLDLQALKGEKGTVKRETIELHINASGTVEPKSRTEIKSKASGDVVEIPFLVGQNVRKGDLLIRLKPDDEQRNVDKSKNEVARAEATLRKAEISKEKLQTDLPISVSNAEHKLTEIKALRDRAKFEWEEKQRIDREMKARGIGGLTRLEMKLVETNYNQTEAQVGQAEAALAQAKANEINIKNLEQDIELAKAALRVAKAQLADTEQRLSETELRAPVDAQIARIGTRIGEVVRGEATSFGGAIPLMVLADISGLYVEANVDEADIGKVRDVAGDWAKPMKAGTFATSKPTEDELAKRAEGAKVKINVESFPDMDFSGVIERISPEPSMSQGVTNYQVRIRVDPEKQEHLLLGMQATVTFTTETRGNVLVVPFEAVQTGPDNLQKGVYVPAGWDDKGRVKDRFVPLRLGISDGIVYEVLDDGKSLDGKDTLKEGSEIFIRRPIKPDEENQ